MCSLKKARSEDAAPVLAALQESAAGLASLREALDAAARLVDVHVQACRAQLQREEAGLDASRARLQDAVGAEAAVWEQAKQEAAVQRCEDRRQCN